MEKGKRSERTESFVTFSIYHFPFAMASDGPAALQAYQGGAICVVGIVAGPTSSGIVVGDPFIDPIDPVAVDVLGCVRW